MEQTALIIGNPKKANPIARHLLAHNTTVLVSTREKTHSEEGNAAEIITDSSVIRCTGNYGDFRVVLNTGSGNSETVISASIIVIAEEAEITPNFELHGLAPGPRVATLSDIREKAPNFAGRKAVFLTGVFEESSPAVHQKVMESALLLQKEHGVQTWILTGNLKVARHGLEELYQKTREAGTVYVKFTDTKPEILVDEDGGIAIVFRDEIIGDEFKLTPDLVVVDERMAASACCDSLASVLNIEIGSDHFPQQDNVHRNSVQTNRKGILVAGDSLGITAETGEKEDAAALEAVRLLREKCEVPGMKAEVKQGQCVKCLTCYRVCPYSAIVPEVPIHVHEQSCERCGICVANCPQKAVNIPDLDLSEMIADNAGGPVAADSEFKPEILLFGCSRSAVLALDAIPDTDSVPYNIKLVKVPCGGSVSESHILEGFRVADGIMILTCHQDNCHGQRGTKDAENRFAKISGQLREIGFGEDRIQYHTAASNMGYHISDLIGDFNSSLVNAGPNPLKRK